MLAREREASPKPERSSAAVAQCSPDHETALEDDPEDPERKPGLCQELGARPEDAYLTADGVNLPRCLQDLLLKTREPALIVHLQQLQGSAAIAHL